ncbi:MAG: MBL fold metallo-hydrolase [Arenicella sp.]|nr:MBL fold metallo-hydrolase [Arenicella sp.]
MNREFSDEAVVKPDVEAFYDEQTNTFSYVVRDPDSSACAIIDSVLDFDYPSATVSYQGADRIIDYVRSNRLTVEKLIETHVHADHLTAAPYLQRALGGEVVISEHIVTVQQTFAELYNEKADFARDGSQFDRLLKDQQQYKIGKMTALALHTPGHTPACMTHIIGDAAFVGDTLFMPDSGTARVDFPGGDAHTLYQSIQLILNLPDDTRLYMCHDYQPQGRGVEYLSTVADQRDNNIHIKKDIAEQDYVSMRKARDKTLGMPRLILPALQVNMRAGYFPQAESNDTVYLKIPVKGLR